VSRVVDGRLISRSAVANLEPPSGGFFFCATQFAMSGFGTFRTCRHSPAMPAHGGKADIRQKAATSEFDPERTSATATVVGHALMVGSYDFNGFD
jgi:hypothetical protein